MMKETEGLGRLLMFLRGGDAVDSITRTNRSRIIGLEQCCSVVLEVIMDVIDTSHLQFSYFLFLRYLSLTIISFLGGIPDYQRISLVNISIVPITIHCLNI